MGFIDPTKVEGKLIGGSREFEPIIRYKNFAKSPTAITKQTYGALELLRQGTIRESKLIRDYLHDYTFSYLNQAEKGANTIYDRKGAVYRDLNLETEESAHHAYIVFGHLPDKVTSSFLRNGFSRKGMLRAPETRDEFLKRINELKVGIWQTIDKRVGPQTMLEAYPRLLRTYGFFKVGSELPIKMPEDKKKIQDEKLGIILKDVDVSL